MIPTSPRSLSDSCREERSHHRLPCHRDFEWTPPGTDSDSPPPSPRPHRWPNHNNYVHQPRASRCMDSSYRKRHHCFGRPHSESLCGSLPCEVPFSSLPTSLPLENVPGRSSSIITAALSRIRSNRHTFHHKQSSRRHKQDTGTIDSSMATAKATRRVTGRARGMEIAESTSSRKVSVPVVALDLPPLQLLSSSSSSSRNNKIYVRIKRLTSEKATKTTTPTTDTDDRDRFRFRSDQSSSVPGSCKRSMYPNHNQNRIHNSKTMGRLNESLSFLSNGIRSSSSVCGWNPNKGGTRNLTGDTAIIGFKRNDTDDDGDAEARFDDDESFPGVRSFPEHYQRTLDKNNNVFCKHNIEQQHHFRRPLQQSPSSDDRILMIQSLLAIETGPISWALISKEKGSRPPESFVRYLATVLSEGVQLYLKRNTGKEYWIKHVLFWSDLLDPRRDWWNNTTREGFRYRVLAKRLHTSLNKRWGYNSCDNLIECQESHVQKVFVRACILFAQKKSNSHSNRNNVNNNTDDDEDGTSDRCEPVG